MIQAGGSFIKSLHPVRKDHQQVYARGGYKRKQDGQPRLFALRLNARIGLVFLPIGPKDQPRKTKRPRSAEIEHQGNGPVRKRRPIDHHRHGQSEREQPDPHTCQGEHSSFIPGPGSEQKCRRLSSCLDGFSRRRMVGDEALHPAKAQEKGPVSTAHRAPETNSDSSGR